jgi:phasin family protein
MSSANNNKPPGKPAQRSRKTKQASKQPDQRQRPKPDQQPDRRQDEKELIEAAVAPTETFPIETEASAGAPSTGAAIALTETCTAVALTAPPSKGALVPMDFSPIAVALPVEAFFIGFQAIANAYREHTRRSIEETLSFVEKFTAVRSLDKAIEIQSEFTKQTCETFVADSQKIWRLYSELARQILKPFERLVMRVTQTAR